MEIKEIRKSINNHLNYIIKYLDLIKPLYLIEKSETLARSFNNNYYAFRSAPRLKRLKHIDHPPEVERYLRKLTFFIIRALDLYEEIIDKIDDKRQEKGI